MRFPLYYSCSLCRLLVHYLSSCKMLRHTSGRPSVGRSDITLPCVSVCPPLTTRFASLCVTVHAGGFATCVVSELALPALRYLHSSCLPALLAPAAHYAVSSLCSLAMDSGRSAQRRRVEMEAGSTKSSPHAKKYASAAILMQPCWCCVPADHALPIPRVVFSLSAAAVLVGPECRGSS